MFSSSCSKPQSFQLRYFVGNSIVQTFGIFFGMVEVLQKVFVHDLLFGYIFVVSGLQLREVMFDVTETLGLFVCTVF